MPFADFAQRRSRTIEDLLAELLGQAPTPAGPRAVTPQPIARQSNPRAGNDFAGLARNAAIVRGLPPPGGYPQPGSEMGHDGTGGPVVFGRGQYNVTPQPTGGPATMPGAGNAFLQFLLQRMAGRGGASMAAPMPSPSMDPRNVICDEYGNCRPVSRR